MEFTAWLTSPSARSSSTDWASSRVRVLDLAFEGRVGVLQLGRHAVELVAERLQLVAGLDRDALRQIAAADACRAVAQRTDRNDHPAGEIQARKRSQHECRHEQRSGALDRGVKGRIGLFYRQLDEYEPAQRANPGMRAQNLAILHVADDRRRVLMHVELRRERRAHLIKPRQVGVAQHHADVRMGDQAPLRIDHVGLPVLSDLDLRHYVPDEFQAHFRDDRTVFTSNAGHCQRHVGL